MKRQDRPIFIAMIVVSVLILLQEQAPGQAHERDSNYSHAVGSHLSSIAPPTFTSGTRIQANGLDIKVDSYASATCVADWNGDGKKDLLVGCFYYGNVYLYLNSGSNSSPVFTTASKLQANGSDISVAYG